ncbi:MAG TPA: hypothetical protein VN900_14600, partial [Stellaceae bacterium]|nr:hypothetical protein [Stellaceae bacterium]
RQILGVKCALSSPLGVGSAGGCGDPSAFDAASGVPACPAFSGLAPFAGAIVRTAKAYGMVRYLTGSSG